jgi:hypothetical protein
MQTPLLLLLLLLTMMMMMMAELVQWSPFLSAARAAVPSLASSLG